MAEPEGSSALLRTMAEAAGVDPKAYMAALQEVCGCPSAKPGHFIALLHVANKYGLDPLLKQIGLMTVRLRGGGEQPAIYVSVDGWMKCLINHPDYLMWRHEDSWSGGAPGKGVIEAVTVYIYRKSWNEAGLPPFSHTEYLRECKRDTGPWSSHPARMLLERAVGQATRFCFGMYVPEAEEWEKAEDVAEQRGEVAPASAPISLVPALRVQAQVVPEAASANVAPHAAAAPIDEARVIDVTTTAGRKELIDRVVGPATAAKLPEYDRDASLAVDAALDQGKEGFDDLEF